MYFKQYFKSYKNDQRHNQKINLTSLCVIVRQKYDMPKLSVPNQESDKNKENH